MQYLGEDLFLLLQSVVVSTKHLKFKLGQFSYTVYLFHIFSNSTVEHRYLHAAMLRLNHTLQSSAESEGTRPSQSSQIMEYHLTDYVK